MTISQLAAILTAAAGLVTAVTALIHSIRTRQQIQPGQPAGSVPHSDTERAEVRDVPTGFAPPEARA